MLIIMIISIMIKRVIHIINNNDINNRINIIYINNDNNHNLIYNSDIGISNVKKILLIIMILIIRVIIVIRVNMRILLILAIVIVI